MCSPIRKQSCCQWLNELHFEECLLLGTLGILIWSSIILYSQFQFRIAILVHLPCLCHDILRRTTAEYRTIQEYSELPSKFVIEGFTTLVVECLVWCTCLIAKSIEGADGRMVSLSLYLKVITFAIGYYLVVGIIADDLFIHTTASHAKHAELPYQEGIDMSLNYLSTIQINGWRASGAQYHILHWVKQCPDAHCI